VFSATMSEFLVVRTQDLSSVDARFQTGEKG